EVVGDIHDLGTTETEAGKAARQAPETYQLRTPQYPLVEGSSRSSPELYPDGMIRTQSTTAGKNAITNSIRKTSSRRSRRLRQRRSRRTRAAAKASTAGRLRGKLDPAAPQGAHRFRRDDGGDA